MELVLAYIYLAIATYTLICLAMYVSIAIYALWELEIHKDIATNKNIAWTVMGALCVLKCALLTVR
jgi:hypothetical protein